MSSLYEKVFGKSWVGTITFDGQEEVITVEVVDQQIKSNLPARRLFRLPVTISIDTPDRLEWQIELPQGRFTCVESPTQGVLETVTSPCWFGMEEGSLLHLPLLNPQNERFHEWMGIYQASNKTLYFGQDPRPELPLFFYEQNNQITRLYPISWNRFLSETCERFVFQDNSVPTLLWVGSNDKKPVILEQEIPYHEERVQIPTPDGHTLGASLLLPDTPAPHPAILFCHFANTHVRDYYRLYANHFLHQGMATLIYDKRGWGDSTGEPLFSHIQPLADDAVAVYRYLQSRSDIDPDKIGFWGASNGGWVAPLAASRVEQPACVIAVSAAGVTPAYQEQGRRVNIVRELGASDEAIELLDRMWHLLMEFYVNGGWTHELEAIVQQVNNHAELQALPKQQDYGPGLQAVPPILPIEELKAEGGTWADGGFDPAPVYAALKCPLLFVWGEAETVIPLEESVSRLSEALTHAHHPDFQMVRLPDMTHMMYRVPPAVEGLQPHEVEARLHGVQFADGFREQMADWAKARLQKESL